MRDFLEDIDWSRWAETAWTAALRVAVILALLYITLRVLERILQPTIRATVSRQMAGSPESEVEKRVDTIYGVVTTSITTAGVIIALVTILPVFGINVAALIAGAGILGFAIGFGSQSLVKDIIAGLFILLENQYGKGDVVSLAGVNGLVEDVNLRRTLLRDLDGTVHSIPNGEIKVASNLTRSRSRVNFVISVSTSQDIERVFEVINRTGQQLADDPEWQRDILEAPKALGIEDLHDGQVEIRVLGDTLPIRQWDVSRELRKRLKAAFEDDNIQMS
jgi:small conductance mechanosensitive channel